MEEEKNSESRCPGDDSSSEENSENSDGRIEPETGENISSRHIKIARSKPDETSEDMHQMVTTEIRDTSPDDKSSEEASSSGISSVHVVAETSGYTKSELAEEDVDRDKMDKSKENNTTSDKKLMFSEVDNESSTTIGSASSSDMGSAVEFDIKTRRDVLIEEASSSKSSSNNFHSPSGESSGDSHPISSVKISEVSAASADISMTISCLDIRERENQPSPTITLPDTPPKRKHRSPGQASKKVRLLEQSDETVKIKKSTDTEQVSCSTSTREEFVPTASSSADVRIDPPSIEETFKPIPEQHERVVARRTRKRTKEMSSEDMDVSEQPSETKKKKDSD